MVTSQRSQSRGLVWAIIGGFVLMAGVVAIVVTAVVSQQGPTTPPIPETTSTPSPTAPAGSDDVFVDPTASAHGWIPEPITTDPEPYIRAALEAASTFDTTKGSRDEWLTYLDTWFTPDTRYSASDQPARMKAAQLELRQGVVLPEDQWTSLAAEDGRVVAKARGDVTFVPVTEDPSGDLSIGTADVTLTYTRSDESDGETSYDEVVRVSVQVLCGERSVPTPNSAQQAGDCKVVRYFAEPMEP